jgi:hypothetical protein
MGLLRLTFRLLIGVVMFFICELQLFPSHGITSSTDKGAAIQSSLFTHQKIGSLFGLHIFSRCICRLFI